jgi:elongation factor Ts
MTGAVIELNAETDFVARNETFQIAARSIGVAALDQGEIEALGGAKVASGETVNDMVTNMIATIGENMNLRRVKQLTVAQGAVASYVHASVGPDVGKIGVLVALEGAGDQAKLADVGRKIAMHVAATNPLSLSTDDLDQAAVEREKAIFTEQALESGKPPAVVEKMVEGRIRKFYEEVVLLKQSFVMNPDQTIEQLIAETAKETGSPVTVKGYVRFGLGDGIEKKVDDFAAEVASMTGQG